MPSPIRRVNGTPAQREQKSNGKVPCSRNTHPFFFFTIFLLYHSPSSVRSIFAKCGFDFVRVCVLEMGSCNLLKTASEEAAAEVCLS